MSARTNGYVNVGVFVCEFPDGLLGKCLGSRVLDKGMGLGRSDNLWREGVPIFRHSWSFELSQKFKDSQTFVSQ